MDNKKTFVIVLITILLVVMVKMFLIPATLPSHSLSTKDDFAILSASFKKNFYEDCANKIIFPASSLYDEVEIIAKEAIVHQDSSCFWIIPQKNTTTLKLHLIGKKNRNLVYETQISVNVVKPPQAQMISLLNGRITHIDSLKLTDDEVGSRLTVKIKPDTIFERQCPKDNEYEFTKVEVFIQNILNEKHRIGEATLSGRNANKGLDFPFHSAFFRPVNASIHFLIHDIRRKKYNGLYDYPVFTPKEIIVRKRT